MLRAECPRCPLTPIVFSLPPTRGHTHTQVEWTLAVDRESGVSSQLYRFTVANSSVVVAPWALLTPTARAVRVPINSRLVPDGASLQFELMVINNVGVRATFTRTGVKDTTAPACTAPVFVLPPMGPSYLTRLQPDQALTSTSVRLRCTDPHTGVANVTVLVGTAPGLGDVLRVPVPVPSPGPTWSVALQPQLTFPGVHGACTVAAGVEGAGEWGGGWG
jgi:hypothetical protein